MRSSPSGLGNSYGGRVLTFTTGPAKGFSARIYNDYFRSPTEQVFRIPTASVSGDFVKSDNGAFIATSTVGDLFNSEVIINGRDFSGTGADVVFNGVTPSSLGGEAVYPNRVGQLHADLVGLDTNPDGTTRTPTNPYSVMTESGTITPWEASVNEPWDAPDIATMFLSGRDSSGNFIPSFFRAGNTGSSGGGKATFHAFDVNGDNTPDVDTDGDGTVDSFWMDLGLSIVTNRSGQRFKPLFAVQIRDMDGLLNVNAHSNQTHVQADRYVDAAGSWTPAGTTPYGLGMGPAETDLSGLLGTTVLQQLLNERYGDDNLPGDGQTSFRSRAKLFGYPDTTIGTTGGLFSSPMDIYGRYRTGSPISSAFPDPNYPTFNNGLPQIDMLTKQTLTKPGGLTDEFAGNPYEMSLSGDSSADRPFTPEELERFLRPNDIDSSILPDRFTNILGTAGTGLLTTDSYDVPMLYRDFVEEMVRNISLRSSLNSTEIETLIPNLVDPDIQFAFAPELFRGLKMDINRPFGSGQDENNNGIFNEPGEAANNADATGVLGSGEIAMDLTYGTALTVTSRELYARHLYMLAMLLLEPVDMDKSGTVDNDDRLAFAKAMAQWAVNVVDFRDPDSIHTRFVYDPFPWDMNGFTPSFDAADAQGRVFPTYFVWGAERPELLLTETLAVHIQNMEKKASDPTMYEQRLRPEPFAYFEVSNPWTQNPLNQRPPAELYGSNAGVDLGKKTADESPVWRFEVERAEVPAAAGDPIEYKPLRYVYMTRLKDNKITYTDANENQVPTDIEIFSNSGTSAIVLPGRQALIGTKGFEDPNDASSFQVFMGRRSEVTVNDAMGTDATGLMLDETTRLALNQTTGEVRRYTASNTEESTRNTSIVFIDKSTTGDAPSSNGSDRKFSLSDPYQGYPNVAPGEIEIPDGDGYYYTPAKPQTLDQVDGNRITAEDIAMIRIQDGISKNFRYVRLQRLANPLLNWNAVTNPYLTIDSMEVDLVSINGADEENAMLTDTGVNYAVSHERGDATGTVDSRVQLWGSKRTNIRPANGASDMNHHFVGTFGESLGRTNDAFIANPGTPFPWLTWNNRPFVSHTEIMNVPYLAPDRLTFAPEAAADPASPRPTQPFTIDDAIITDLYGATDGTNATRLGGLAGRYGHLLNFFAAEDDTASATNAVSDAYKLLDYIEVPSRFVNNESYYLTTGASGVFTHPFNTISRYRAPGKININTIPSSNVWDALVSGQVAWSDVQTTLHQDTSGNAMDFGNPFRPAAALNLVPGVTSTSTVGSACMLTRPADTSTTQVPLFDYTTSTMPKTRIGMPLSETAFGRGWATWSRPSPACLPAGSPWVISKSIRMVTWPTLLEPRSLVQLMPLLRSVLKRVSRFVIELSLCLIVRFQLPLNPARIITSKKPS